MVALVSRPELDDLVLKRVVGVATTVEVAHFVFVIELVHLVFVLEVERVRRDSVKLDLRVEIVDLVLGRVVEVHFVFVCEVARVVFVLGVIHFVFVTEVVKYLVELIVRLKVVDWVEGDEVQVDIRLEMVELVFGSRREVVELVFG